MFNLSTLLLGCNTPSIVISFLDFLSTSFSSLSFHCSIPAPYLNKATAHTFIVATLFFPFIFDFRCHRSLHLYSFTVFSFIPFSLTLTSLTMPKLFLFGLLHYFIIWSFIPSHLITFPLFMVIIIHVFIPNFIPISVLKTWAFLTSVSIRFSFLENSSELCMNIK